MVIDMTCRFAQYKGIPKELSSVGSCMKYLYGFIYSSTGNISNNLYVTEPVVDILN